MCEGECKCKKLEELERSYAKDQAVPAEVAKKFQHFLDQYDDFRETNGLSGSVDNVYEILTAMSDKHGRICRQVKHFERDDQKPDWPDGLTEAMVGYVTYMVMLIKRYDVDVKQGFVNELQSAIDQYADKG